MNIGDFTGIAAFGRAYEFMLANDAHAPGSVDRILAQNMVRLCEQTADELYGAFTALEIGYRKGSRPELERVLAGFRSNTDVTLLKEIAGFTRGLGDSLEDDLNSMQLGGTEESIISRGSDWCTVKIAYECHKSLRVQ